MNDQQPTSRRSGEGVSFNLDDVRRTYANPPPVDVDHLIAELHRFDAPGWLIEQAERIRDEQKDAS